MRTGECTSRAATYANGTLKQLINIKTRIGWGGVCVWGGLEGQNGLIPMQLICDKHENFLRRHHIMLTGSLKRKISKEQKWRFYELPLVFWWMVAAYL